ERSVLREREARLVAARRGLAQRVILADPRLAAGPAHRPLDVHGGGELVEELVVAADRVDHHAHLAARDLRGHVERLAASLAHVLAHELRPEARVPGPAEPLDRPAVLHVAGPRERPAEAHAP